MQRCPTCNQRIEEREIVLYTGMVRALWAVYKWCRERGVHEFQRKDIKHLFINENDTARFGDWVMFGGLVYKHGKGHYGLNIERCDRFFMNQYQIPLRAWKSPVTGEVKLEEYRTVSQIPKLTQFLNEDKEYISRYREPASLF